MTTRYEIRDGRTPPKTARGLTINLGAVRCGSAAGKFEGVNDS